MRAGLSPPSFFKWNTNFLTWLPQGTVKLTKIQLTNPQDIGLGSRREPAMLGIRLGRST